MKTRQITVECSCDHTITLVAVESGFVENIKVLAKSNGWKLLLDPKPNSKRAIGQCPTCVLHEKYAKECCTA